MTNCKRHTILLVDRYPAGNDIARALLPPGFELVIARHGTPTFDAAIGRADFLLTFSDRRLDDAFYATAPCLKLVQLAGSGYNHCDIEAARRARVPIATDGGGNAGSVAEHTIMLMLAASRRVVWLHNKLLDGEWRADGLLPNYRELAGATLGVIGMGNIGRKVARLGSAFGMKVIYNSRTPLSPDQEDATGFRFALLSELLREADFVTIHVPLTAQTRHLIGARELASMKPDAILVNTSRGDVIDEAALVDVLQSRGILAAGLDTFALEPLPAGHALSRLDNVVLTPHRAAFSVENLKTRFQNFYLNFTNIASGHKPNWVIPQLRDVIR